MTDKAAETMVSVVIPTHNPRMDYLRRVVEALRGQTLPREQWELLVVDNGSRVPLKAGAGRQDDRSARPQDCRTSLPSNLPTFPPFTAQLDLSWHANARVVREEKLGLTFARLRGFAEAKGDLIVLVDDDNVLAPDYLENAVSIAQRNPALGAFGGKCAPEFEVEPPKWLRGMKLGLGLQDHGRCELLFPCDQAEKASPSPIYGFPDCAPIGAGMVIRREAAAAYAERIEQRTTGRQDHGTAERSETGCRGNQQTITDRKGDSLASGGDNDICLTVLEAGWQVGYLPQLVLTHLISKGRMTLDYQRRMARDAVRSYLLMLDQHGIRPHAKIPRWSVPLRIAKDFLRVRPWRSPEASLEWHSHIGQYLARAELA